MEGESAVEQALSFDFNYHHFLNNQNLQTSPIEIAEDFSNELQFEGELGSSCGSNELIMIQQNNNIKQNLTATTSFSGELLEQAEDNVASLMETPQNIWDNGIGIISSWMNQDQLYSLPLITPLRSRQFPCQNNQAPVTPEVYQPSQGCETMVPQQTLRPEINQPRGLPYQNGRRSDPIDTYQQNPFFNSETHQSLLGKKRRFEVGESPYLSSSSSSKRFRFDEPTRKNQEDWNPDSQGISTFSNFSNSRVIKSSVYDPFFEGIGLPIDPHLRVFALRY